jgi:hypothetical protein
MKTNTLGSLCAMYSTIALDFDDTLAMLRERDRLVDLKGLMRPLNLSDSKLPLTYQRKILVSWLSDVAEEYHLAPQTLHLAVLYLDRFLLTPEGKKLSTQTLQCYGVACVSLAAKYEETHRPYLDDYTYITAYAYTRTQITEAETEIINVLKFELTCATSYDFATYYLARYYPTKEKLLVMIRYLCELTLSFHTYREFSCEIVGRAAVMAGLKLLNCIVDDNIIAENTAETTGVVDDIVALYHAAKTLDIFKEIHQTYSSCSRLKVATCIDTQ